MGAPTHQGFARTRTIAGGVAYYYPEPGVTPINLSISLSSTDSARAIALQFSQGGTWHTATNIDFTATGQIVVATTNPVYAIRASSGTDGDVMTIVG